MNLKFIDLCHNLISDWEGAEEWETLTALKQLNLRGNPIRGSSIEELQANHKGEDELEITKEMKTGDAVHKQYNFRMKRLFPNLIIRDGNRLLNKQTHGFVKKVENKKTNSTKEKKEKRKAKENVKEETPLKKSKEVDMEQNGGAEKQVEDKSVKKTKRQKMDKKIEVVAENTVENVEEKRVKKVKKAKRQKSEELVSEPVLEPVVVQESVAKSPMESTSTIETSTVIKKAKKSKKKDEKVPTSQSGVVAVKMSKKTKKTKKVNIAAVDFTTTVGGGGDSTWD